MWKHVCIFCVYSIVVSSLVTESPPRPSAGGLPGAAAASHRRAAGKGQQPADGRAVLPASGRVPPAGGSLLHDPSAAAGDPGVQSWWLVAQQHCAQVLLQWNSWLEVLQRLCRSAGVLANLRVYLSSVTTDYKTSRILQENIRGFYGDYSSWKGFRCWFPAYENITKTWCRGCGMCNSLQGVKVDEVMPHSGILCLKYDCS